MTRGIVIVKYGDCENRLIGLGLLNSLDSLECTYPYKVIQYWKYAHAVDCKGNEITDV